MDVVSHFNLKRPLFRLEAGDGLFVSSAFDTARGELVTAVLACESPVVLTGLAGSGKSVLLAEVARQLAARGLKVSLVQSPALAQAANFALLNVVLVDEAGPTHAARIAAICDTARKHGRAVVFAALGDAHIPAARRSVHLSPMNGRQACDFLLDAAARAGRADLFSADAQDAIVAAAFGMPRIVKLIANGAVMEAMFEGSDFVQLRHVNAAVAAKAPLPPPAPDYSREGPRLPDSAQPIRIAVAVKPPPPEIRRDIGGIDEDDVDVLLPLPPADEPRSRMFGDVRGVIVGTGALGLLLVAAGVYGANAYGLDHISDYVRVRISGAVAATSAAPPASPAVAPPADLPAAAVPDAPPPIEATQSDPEPEPETALAAPGGNWGSLGPDYVAPPMPTPDTPGYRPPPPTMPTTAAAVRAGIAVHSADASAPRATDVPREPLSIGSTTELLPEADVRPLDADGEGE